MSEKRQRGKDPHPAMRKPSLSSGDLRGEEEDEKGQFEATKRPGTIRVSRFRSNKPTVLSGSALSLANPPSVPVNEFGILESAEVRTIAVAVHDEDGNERIFSFTFPSNSVATVGEVESALRDHLKGLVILPTVC